jgi:hypothetical protein
MSKDVVLEQRAAYRVQSPLETGLAKCLSGVPRRMKAQRIYRRQNDLRQSLQTPLRRSAKPLQSARTLHLRIARPGARRRYAPKLIARPRTRMIFLGTELWSR